MWISLHYLLLGLRPRSSGPRFELGILTLQTATVGITHQVLSEAITVQFEAIGFRTTALDILLCPISWDSAISGVVIDGTTEPSW